MSIWTKDFWRATAERVIATVAQVAISYIVLGGTTSLFDLEWESLFGIVGMSALLSFLKCLVANAATKTGPSLTKASEVAPDNVRPVPVQDAATNKPI